MSHSVQAVTLTLTLPLSCQICLGKVRKPKICCNHHVFCSACIDIWLKKSSQCPTCRVDITADNPCREIIGATNESDVNENHSVKKHLRKTRGELLLREYEDEIETLLKENEELKSKNLSLETQLRSALEPGTGLRSPNRGHAVEPAAVQEWLHKLETANQLYNKVKDDMDKLKEANRTLRSQTVDLIQENMHLKAEVESRSPQKFGRFTVAALEAKIVQYERDMTQLKRALERSDKYIEELEAQAALIRRERPTENGAPEKPQVGAEYARIAAAIERLSQTEEKPLCTERDGNSVNVSNDCFLLTTSESSRQVNPCKPATENVSAPRIPAMPATPSSALGSLSLRSPGVCSERKPESRRPSYLRRLSFDESGSAACFTTSLRSEGPMDCRAMPNPLNEDVLWGSWQDSSSVTPPCPHESDVFFFKARPSGSGSQAEEEKAAMTSSGQSEARMDAAYLDKISELDFMMDEGESSGSRTSQLTLMLSGRPDPSALLISELTGTDRSAGQRRTSISSTCRGEAEASCPAAESESSGVVSGSGGTVFGFVECSGASTKRKCPQGLVTSSPSKLPKSK